MKSSFHEYLIAVLAILVVFACGYGIGQRIGSRPTAVAPPIDAHASWESNVIKRLDSELALNESQRQAIRDEVAASARRIDEVRANARQAYRQELLDLHGRISPLLDATQRERLGKSRAALQHSPASAVSP